MDEKAEVLSIFLAKDGIASIEDLLDDSRDPLRTSIEVGSISGTLFTTSTDPHPPRWASFFKDAVDTSPLLLQTASASALLVLPVKDRLFAITFGYGRHLLNPLAIEARFGLRTTLNSVPIDGIRSIDKKAFEGISTHTREQASKDTEIGDFGLDVERDILRAIVGTPSDASLGTRLAGMDGLTATCKVTLDSLPELLARYLAKNTEETYKKRFGWIDKIIEVRDKQLRARLDDELLRLLRAGGEPRPWLAVPDLISWSDVAGFRYSKAKSADTFPDLHLNDYLANRDVDQITTDNLRTHRAYAMSATTDNDFDRWPVYRCLYAEVEISGATYLLNNGEWYQVNKDFVTSVNDSVRAIGTTDLALIDCNKGEKEPDYNRRLAASIVGGYCMDQKLIYYGGGKSSVEFCDVYSPDRKLIHVKRYGGSSVLSHLFSQGVVSATAFVRDEAFRKEVNKLLPSKLKLKNTKKRPNAAEYEIAYMVTSRSPRPLWLPFFSRLSLRNAQMQLASFDYKVTFSKIQIV